MTDTCLTVWTIYKNPSDYPGKWVLRGSDVPGNVHAEAVVGDTLEEVRRAVPFGLIRLERCAHDDPVIHEIWI